MGKQLFMISQKSHWRTHSVKYVKLQIITFKLKHTEQDNIKISCNNCNVTTSYPLPLNSFPNKEVNAC